jgi:hypothetical protein
MKNVLVAFIFILTFSGSCHADSGVRDSLEKMFELTDMQKMLDNSYAQMDQIFSQMANEKNISDDKKPIYEKHRNKFRAMLIESMSWDKIKEPIINAYSQVYTKAEVDALNEFYQTALGQKLIQKMPELMQATMQVMQETSKSIIPKLQVLQKELQEDLSK